MIRRSGKPQGKFGWLIGDDLYEVKTGYREIRYQDGRMRVLAADAATGDGVIPTLALVDELHRHRSMDLYGVLADGLEAPPPGGRGGSLADFTRFCKNLRLENDKPLTLEPHEKEILRLYFKGVRELVVVLAKKNGKTTLLAALGLYHLKVGSRVRQLITISTAGTAKESPLGVLRDKAHELPSFKRRGVKNTASSEDGSFAWLEWCLSDEDDLEDMKLVKKANPASWHTISTLKSRYMKPAMTPGRWARFACGVWTEGEDPWIEAKDWDRLKVDIGCLEAGDQVWIAVSIGMNPGIAIVAQRPDGAVAVAAEVFEGDVNLGQIEGRLVELASIYEVEDVFWGEPGFMRSAELLASQGMSVKNYPFKARLPIVSLTLKRLINERKLRHDGDKRLRAQVMGGAAKETQSGWQLIPSAHSRALIAMAVAVHQATQVKRPSVYETRDLGVFG